MKLKSAPLSFAVLIPAFNVDNQKIEAVVERVWTVCRRWRPEIVIVDDGSRPPVRLPSDFVLPVKILRHAVNRGKGAALKSGFHYLLEKKRFPFIITLDADLQHPPEEIPRFLSAYRVKRGKIIVGSRSKKLSVMPVHRILSNILTSLIISGLTGQLVRDSQCGFRLVDTGLLKSLVFRENKFHLESEMLVRCGWQNEPIAFVPIPTIYNQEKSSINPLRDTVNFISLIVGLMVERVLGRCMKS